MVKMGNVIAVWLLNLLVQLQKSLLRISIQVKPNYLCVHQNDVLKSVSLFKHCKQRLSIITLDSCNYYQRSRVSSLCCIKTSFSPTVFCASLIKQQSIMFKCMVIHFHSCKLLNCCVFSVYRNWFPNYLSLYILWATCVSSGTLWPSEFGSPKSNSLSRLFHSCVDTNIRRN